jgi:hypothetical protein
MAITTNYLKQVLILLNHYRIEQKESIYSALSAEQLKLSKFISIKLLF